jgi:hypothetical protein
MPSGTANRSRIPRPPPLWSADHLLHELRRLIGNTVVQSQPGAAFLCLASKSHSHMDITARHKAGTREGPDDMWHVVFAEPGQTAEIACGAHAGCRDTFRL